MGGRGTYQDNWEELRKSLKLLEHHFLAPAVRQDPLLGSSETFNSFLRRAQQVRLGVGPRFKGRAFL